MRKPTKTGAPSSKTGGSRLKTSSSGLKAGGKVKAGADREARERILNLAREKFILYGFSKFTMDELASALGMSKKTLYKHFHTKEDILRGMSMQMMEEAQEKFDPIVEDASMSFFERIERLLALVQEMQWKSSKVFIEDIARNAYHVWKEIEAFRQTRFEKLGELLRQGMHEGIFRNDLNEDAVVLLFVGSIQYLVNPQRVTELDVTPRQLLQTIFTVIFEGILTEKGAKQLADSRTSQPASL